MRTIIIALATAAGCATQEAEIESPVGSYVDEDGVAWGVQRGEAVCTAAVWYQQIVYNTPDCSDEPKVVWPAPPGVAVCVIEDDGYFVNLGEQIILDTLFWTVGRDGRCDLAERPEGPVELAWASDIFEIVHPVL